MLDKIKPIDISEIYTEDGYIELKKEEGLTDITAIKPWIIRVRCNGSKFANYYGAFSKEAPEISDEFCKRAVNELWENYIPFITDWNGNFVINGTEEEQQTYLNQIFDNFMRKFEIYHWFDIENKINNLEIIYDERN